MDRQDFFINSHDRIFTVRYTKRMGQHFVCGTIDTVVKYIMDNPQWSVLGVYEIGDRSYQRMTKNDLKWLLYQYTYNDLSDYYKEYEDV